jgi:hypothetical protein
VAITEAPLAASSDPIGNRTLSSLAMVADRVHEVHRAARAADEAELRSALVDLSSESLLLARQPDLIPSPLSVRIRIAAESDPAKRSGC